MIRTALRLSLGVLLVLLLSDGTQAQIPRRSPAPPAIGGRPQVQPIRAPGTTAPMSGQPMRKPAELINRQPPIVINKGVYDSLSSDEARVVVSLSKQRAYLLKGEQLAIDSPISSGKRAGMTRSGHFSVLEKDKDHRSSVYGDFKDSSGRTVRSGVSTRIDSAPSGTHFEGAPMLWFMRLTGDGVGMHIGILPGYPASHGCIRMPPQGAEMFYAKVKIGTPVTVSSD
ncbi:MAG: L,D-transpeptidase family protein [Verrucomicrobiota bacterium]|nr:L,D-transpeptidase family protein [Verrucomicrobiota bacterium]